MSGDVVTVPVSLMIFLGGLIVSMLSAMLTFSGHLLISIRNSMASLAVELGLKNTKIEARIDVLERHDQRNEDDKQALLRWQREQERP